ncbi:hypothetical protein EDD17DRAFT_1622931 [Pisolithus thermaeus]|nr:hypothetical protein EDD17DRAFT_1622931 [Pisolithus thermaeus]
MRSHGGGTSSVYSVLDAAAVPHSYRFNPIALPSTCSATKVTRRMFRNEDCDNEDEDFQSASSNSSAADARPETIHPEQRRRNESRDGYRRFKHALSVPNQRSSNVSLLGRDTTDVKYLDATVQQL